MICIFFPTHVAHSLLRLHGLHQLLPSTIPYLFFKICSRKGAGNIPSESCWSLQSKSPQNNQTENGLNPAKLLGLCQEKMNGVLMPWYNIGKEWAITVVTFGFLFSPREWTFFVFLNQGSVFSICKVRANRQSSSHVNRCLSLWRYQKGLEPFQAAAWLSILSSFKALWNYLVIQTREDDCCKNQSLFLKTVADGSLSAAVGLKTWWWELFWWGFLPLLILPIALKEKIVSTTSTLLPWTEKSACSSWSPFALSPFQRNCRMSWVGRNLNEHPVPTLCRRQGCHSLDQV